MIISASYRTDIPAFYGAWLMNRIEAGFCRTVNPYGGQIYEISLRPEAVDGFVFWTRNAGPFLECLDRIHGLGYPFILHQTAIGYPPPIDARTIAPERAAEQLQFVAARFGARAAVWRYDPILITSLTPPPWHRRNFRAIAAKMRGATDEVIVSFAQIYKKTLRNLNISAAANGFSWEDPSGSVKSALLGDLAGISRQYGMTLTLCGQPGLVGGGLAGSGGVAEASCVDARRLADSAGHAIEAVRKPHRQECGCWQSRDIGAYDTCPQGCVYCYAVRDRALAKQKLAGHDEDSAFLSRPK